MKFVIVGGGITGWLSALIFSERQPLHEYVVVESSDINTIGVGEGTTGFFTDIIENLSNTNLKEFLREAKATPKIGIEFNGWSGNGSTFFNPIDGTPTTEDVFDSLLYYTYIKNKSLDTSSEHGLLKKLNKSPFYIESNKLQDHNTALHLDNKLTIEYLKKKSLEKSQIKLISDTVSKIDRDETGRVKKIICNDHVVEGDIFIDCTGFKRIFSKDSDWISFKKNLPMNSVTTFTRKHDGDVEMFTKSNKLKHGWCWQIPTQERIGCGYVNCDDWSDDVIEEIESNYPDAEIKKSFKFDSGKLKKSWDCNVISLGLAYHFLEPLQATNIHLTLVQIEILCQRYIRNSISRTFNESMISSYNKYVNELVEDFKNFINVHYSRDQRVDLTDYNKEIINLVKIRGLFTDDLPQLYGGTGVGLWGHTLLGLNHISKEDCHAFLNEMNLLHVAANESNVLEEFSYSDAVDYLSYKDLIDNLYI